MGAAGGLWGPMGTYGGLWGAVGSCGDLWGPMGTYGGLLGPMGTYGDLWGPMGARWGLWGPMGTYGGFWGPVVACGDLWGGPIGAYGDLLLAGVPLVVVGPGRQGEKQVAGLSDTAVPRARQAALEEHRAVTSSRGAGENSARHQLWV